MGGYSRRAGLRTCCYTEIGFPCFYSAFFLESSHTNPFDFITAVRNKLIRAARLIINTALHALIYIVNIIFIGLMCVYQ